MGTDPRPQHFQRFRGDSSKDQSRHAAGRIFLRHRVEGIIKRLANPRFDPLLAENRQVVAQVLAEDAQIVHAEEVVGVAVRVEHGMNQPDALANQLAAQLGRGVDEQIALGQSQGHAAPAPLVFRIDAGAGREPHPMTGTP